MKLRYVLPAVLILTLSAAAQGPLPPQPLTFTQISTFGLVGLATGQMARVNVVNLGLQSFLGNRVQPGTMPSPALPAPAACQVQVQFLDPQGNTIGQPTTPPNLDTGKSASVDLPGPGGTATAPQRIQFRAVIRTSTPTPMGGVAFRPACNILATLEIIDTTTLQTRILLENPRQMPMAIAQPMMGSSQE